MRTIKNLNIPQETDYVKFPDSTIKNETEVAEGTPVVREIYGDILTNFYAYLRDRKIIANELEDNELNGYQFIQALKKATNELNDIEQVLTKTGSTWNSSFDLSLLPDKYVFFARASENYDDSVSYTFKGSGVQVYDFISTGFEASEELMIVIDQTTVRAYNISTGTGNLNEIFTPFGTPLSYNDSVKKIWYQEEGIVFSDLPETYDLQERIQLTEGESTLLVYEMISLQNNIVCFSWNPITLEYKFWRFEYGNFVNPIPITVSGFTIGSGFDYKMHIYFDKEFVYLTNGANLLSDDNMLSRCVFDLPNNLLSLVSIVELDAGFTKTTNGIADKNGIVVLIDGKLTSFNFNQSVIDLGNYTSFIGNIFRIKDDIYYSNGEIAKKWTLNNI